MSDDYDDGNVLGPGGPRLLKDKCPTCIFRPGNPMHLNAGRVKSMVDKCLQGGGFITCHSTLKFYGRPIGPSICRGFYDAHADSSNLLRIFARLGGFVEVDLPPEPEGKQS